MPVCLPWLQQICNAGTDGEDCREGTASSLTVVTGAALPGAGGDGCLLTGESGPLRPVPDQPGVSAFHLIFLRYSPPIAVRYYSKTGAGANAKIDSVGVMPEHVLSHTSALCMMRLAVLEKEMHQTIVQMRAPPICAVHNAS